MVAAEIDCRRRTIGGPNRSRRIPAGRMPQLTPQGAKQMRRPHWARLREPRFPAWSSCCPRRNCMSLRGTVANRSPVVESGGHYGCQVVILGCGEHCRILVAVLARRIRSNGRPLMPGFSAVEAFHQSAHELCFTNVGPASGSEHRPLLNLQW